ncbi:MAG: type II toxin-antitoxin system RelE/ParE family toxin [Desulfuromonadales bacterium]|nr:type II toxin-antitoxin system RelE/ParE family toxin [Desulfuromonadales bacterium]
MHVKPKIKPVEWIGNSLKDIKAMPEDVQDVFGKALFIAQLGGKHVAAKPLKGFGGAGVLEVVEDNDGDTYRAVYTVRFADVVYVLHVFQKKSKKGIATPQEEIRKVKARLSMAEELHRSKGR